MNHLASAGPHIGRRFRLVDIWMGRDGLRAGWAIGLYLLIFAAFVLALGHLAYVLHHPIRRDGQLTPSRAILMDGVLSCAALIAIKATSMLDGKFWSIYGLRSHGHRIAHFGQGALCGLAAVSIEMGLLVLTHGAAIEQSNVAVHEVIQSGLVWGAAFVLVALFEELMFRGYVFIRLARGIHPLAAALLTSLAFGALHLTNHGESLLGVMQVGGFGLLACLAVWRTGSLAWAVGLHAAWDWSESFLFGTTDSGLVTHGSWLSTHAAGPTWLSGGSVGPEASVLVFPVLCGLALVVLTTLPRVERARKSEARA